MTGKYKICFEIGYRYEQMAQWAMKSEMKDLTRKCYRKAIGVYEEGGNLSAAIRVATLIEDRTKIRKLEAKLK